MTRFSQRAECAPFVPLLGPPGPLRPPSGRRKSLIELRRLLHPLHQQALSRFDSHPLPPICLNSVRNELSARASRRGAPSHGHASTLFGKGSFSSVAACQLPSTTSFCETLTPASPASARGRARARPGRARSREPAPSGPLRGRHHRACPLTHPQPVAGTCQRL